MKSKLFAFLVSLLLLASAANSLSVCREGKIIELAEGEEPQSTDLSPEKCNETNPELAKITEGVLNESDLTSQEKEVKQEMSKEEKDANLIINNAPAKEGDLLVEEEGTKTIEEGVDVKEEGESITKKIKKVEEEKADEEIHNVLEEKPVEKVKKVEEKKVAEEIQNVQEEIPVEKTKKVEEEKPEEEVQNFENNSPKKIDEEIQISLTDANRDVSQDESPIKKSKTSEEDNSNQEGEKTGKGNSLSDGKPFETDEKAPTNLLRGKGKDILLQRFNRSSFGAEVSMKCEPKLLGMIGISSTRVNAEAASPDVRNFCHRNFYSCCSLKDITGLQYRFRRSVRAYKKEVGVIEELLTLFKGPNFVTFFSEHKDSTEKKVAACTSLATKINPKYWDSEFRLESMTEVERLLNEMERYYKRNLYWAANSVCSVCNPFNHQFFDLDKKTVSGSDSTCREILEERDYELRFAKLFYTFIHPTSIAMECLLKNGEETQTENVKEVKNVAGKGESSKALDDGSGEKASTDQQIEQIDKLLNDFDICFVNMNSDSSRCRDLCNRKLGTYNNIIPIMSKVRESIQPIFTYFIDDDSIEAYYEDVNGENFFSEHEDNTIHFLESVEGSDLKVDDLEWNFSSSNGVTVMTDHMNKKFYKKVDILGITLFLLSYFFF